MWLSIIPERPFGLFGIVWKKDLNHPTGIGMTGKTVAWLNYMTSYNKTYGTFAENGNEAFMVLNRIFEPKNGDFNQDEIDNTTYIDPSKYNYIFAETSAESQNFWAQI